MYKDVTKYISCIQYVATKIKNLKNNNTKSVVNYTQNNFNIYFRLYLAILIYNFQKKEKVSNPSKLTKILENEQRHFLNKYKKTANYTYSLKYKKHQLSEQKKKKK